MLFLVSVKDGDDRAHGPGLRRRRLRAKPPARHRLALDTEALKPQSWMGTAFAYWEGPIRFRGSHGGRGYLELTGYPDD
jgi:hypothetical protein